MKQLILASQSPRRKTLLAQLGYDFITQAADIDESTRCNESAIDYVERLAKEKAKVIFTNLSRDQQENTVVIGSDTSVVVEGDILGKPVDEAECITTLMRLSNREHQVFTAIAVVTHDKVASKVVETQVQFSPLTLKEIKQYWLTGEPCDKAGSYAIQGIGGQFVTTIKGSYSAVVGLPLFETTQLLGQVGLPSSIKTNLG